MYLRKLFSLGFTEITLFLVRLKPDSLVRLQFLQFTVLPAIRSIGNFRGLWFIARVLRFLSVILSKSVRSASIIKIRSSWASCCSLAAKV